MTQINTNKSSQAPIYYQASPTAKRFHGCDDYVRLLMGPVGCGKSVTCCMEILARAMRQRLAGDGWRYSRWVVVRNTYNELKTTTIQTWDACVNGRAFGNQQGDLFNPINYGPPIRHQLTFDDVQLEVWFLSLDKPKDTKKLLSLETTGIWLNEVRELPHAILEAATQRCGRYPAQSQGGPSWFGVIMDTNPPDCDHWLYKQFEQDKAEGYSIFKYPPAVILQDGEYVLNPKAENLHNHHPHYYLNQLPGKSHEWIKVYLQGRYGSVNDGKPVYPEYRDAMHCVNDLMADKALPLMLAWDFGLTPACLIVQISVCGQVRVLDELQGVDIGAQSFAESVVQPFLATHYSGFQFVMGQADPAGYARNQANDKLTCIGVLNSLGLATEAACTNQFEPRRNAVAHLLTTLLDGEPGLLIANRCQQLRRGFLGQYCFQRLQVMGAARFRDYPIKNMTSHVHDALQYGCLKALSGLQPMDIGSIVDAVANPVSHSFFGR